MIFWARQRNGAGVWGPWYRLQASQLEQDARYAPIVHNHDSLYVNLTTAQTIAGIKTFSSSPSVPVNSWTISNTAGLQAALDTKVDLTNNQTIAGTKAFSNTIFANGGVRSVVGGFTSSLEGAELKFLRASANYIAAASVGGYIRVVGTVTTSNDTPIANFAPGATTFTGTVGTTGPITAGQGVILSGRPGVNNSIGPSGGSMYIEETPGGNIFMRPNGLAVRWSILKQSN